MSSLEKCIVVVAWAFSGLVFLLKPQLVQFCFVEYQRRYPYPRWVLLIAGGKWWEGKEGLFFIRAIGACMLMVGGIVLALLSGSLAVQR